VKSKGWLDHCQSKHIKEQYNCHRGVRTPLKVIDCHKRRIQTASVESSYICLSYAWGSGAVAHSYNACLPHDLPKTIEDAMYVSVSLGIQYLWVDRYCIDQNDAKAKHDTISSMDSIYQCASLTIIAASGSGPDHGLPGVRGTRRRSSRLSGFVDGLMAIESPYTEIMDSMWNTRGWTYQKMSLSRRSLVFAESQMYFQCGTSDFQEIGEKWWPVRGCECSSGPGQGLTPGLPKVFPAISRSSGGLYS
jgi:hypothetical protein